MSSHNVYRAPAECFNGGSSHLPEGILSLRTCSLGKRPAHLKRYLQGHVRHDAGHGREGQRSISTCRSWKKAAAHQPRWPAPEPPILVPQW